MIHEIIPSAILHTATYEASNFPDYIHCLREILKRVTCFGHLIVKGLHKYHDYFCLYVTIFYNFKVFI